MQGASTNYRLVANCPRLRALRRQCPGFRGLPSFGGGCVVPLSPEGSASDCRISRVCPPLGGVGSSEIARNFSALLEVGNAIQPYASSPVTSRFEAFTKMLSQFPNQRR